MISKALSSVADGQSKECFVSKFALTVKITVSTRPSLAADILPPGAEPEASFTGSRLPPPVRKSARQGQSRIQPFQPVFGIQGTLQMLFLVQCGTS